MKPKNVRALGLSLASLASITLPQTAIGQATHVWDGGAANNDLGDAFNWSTDTAPNGATSDIMRWNGSVAGDLSLSYDTAATLGGSPGLSIDVTAGQTSALTIDGTLSSGLRIGTGGVTIASGAGAFALGNGSAEPFNLTLANAVVALTNNSANTANIRSDVRFAVTSAANNALSFTGGGNWNVAASLAPANSGARIAIMKTGTGELVLSGGGSLQGGATINGGTGYSAVLKEGTTRITGGAYANNNSEFVVGGTDTVGTNTQLIMDGGSLTGISWLSVGRGNGTGATSSDIILNNNAAITATNASFGFNAGNPSTAPKGSVTLNGTSSLTVTGANFYIGESNGSDMTVTVNSGTTLSATAASSTGINVGRNAGKGTLTVNGGTVHAAWVDVANGINNAQGAMGTVTITNGGVLNSEGDFRTGFAGNSATQALVDVDGGTLNVATTNKRWMILGRWDTTNTTVNVVNNGSLNLNAGTDIRFAQSGNVGTNIINVGSGGTITSYSDNKTTANGAGVIDLQLSGGAGSTNRLNINAGGTVAVRAVITGTNTGSAQLNFNGGTLRATGDDANFINLDGAGTTQTVNVLAGGAFIDSNGHTVDVVDDMTGAGTLTKQGAGTLRLLGNDNSLGAAVVSAGTLYINGALGTTGGTTVAAGATIGSGDAASTISGGLHIASGGKVDVTHGLLTLSSGTLSFGGFGFDNLVGLDVYSAADGVYSVFGGSFTLDSANLSNFGIENALVVGENRYAYFEEGSLNVVIIPEPAAALLGSIGALALLRRRR